MQGSIRKRGNTYSWSFDLGYVGGKRKRKEKGGYHTKAECQKALREAIKQYENTGSVFEPSEITVADYLDFWFNSYVKVNCKYNTIKLYTNYINKHIKPSLGTYKLKSITPLVLQEFINKIFKAEYSKSVVFSIFAILKNSFSKAVYPNQYIKENPMNYVTKPKYAPKIDKIKDKVISKEDFNKIIDCFSRNNYEIPLLIMYYTGFRIGEVLGLTWNNVDFDAGTITVSQIVIRSKHCLGSPKTPTSVRTIYVSKTLLEILKEHKKKQLENRLFYGEYYTNYYIDENNNLYTEQINNCKHINFVCTRENGIIITHDVLYKISDKINDKLHIDFTFHNIRHTHATMLIEAGANMKDVQERLGHSNYSTTANVYTHTTEKMRKQTVEIFDKIVGDN